MKILDGFSRTLRRVGKAATYLLSHPLSPFDKDVIVTAADGFKMLCLRENLIERSIACSGMWERSETEIVRQLIQPGHVCIDVGANIGYFSLLMAELGATVYAFEPTSYGYARLMRNLSLNPHLAARIIAVKMGLGEAVGQVTEALEAQFSARRLARDHLETMHFETLDAWWQGPRIHFIKIDVDGHEPRVLRGAERTLIEHQPVVLIEISVRDLARCGGSVAELVAVLLACGYDECQVTHTRERTTLKKIAGAPPPTANLLIFPETLVRSC